MTRGGRYLKLLKQRTSLEMLAPASVLPAQWRNAATSSYGVRRLHVAVLGSAVHELRQCQQKHLPIPAAVMAWFLNHPAPITFPDACRVVGLSPDAVRRALGLPGNVRVALPRQEVAA